MFQKKIKYKVRNKWVHFCYVSEELKEEFDLRVNTLNHLPNYWVMKWAYEDFGMSKINTQKELRELRMRIREMYRSRYPELYIENNTNIDTQGWVRVWYTQHMERELNYVKEQ